MFHLTGMTQTTKLNVSVAAVAARIAEMIPAAAAAAHTLWRRMLICRKAVRSTIKLALVEQLILTELLAGSKIIRLRIVEQ